MLKFGDKEWFEELERRVTFPEKFSFFYNHKHNTIHACIIDTKAQLDNIKWKDHIKWKDLRPSGYLFVPSGSALITVEEIQSAQQYYDVVEGLKESWEASVN
jgi:hypothetical protein